VPVGVVCEQADGTIAIPSRERGRLVFVLPAWKLNLQDGFRSIGKSYGRGERLKCIWEGIADAQGPLLRALSDEARQAF
jgi:hypothetical protein